MFRQTFITTAAAALVTLAAHHSQAAVSGNYEYTDNGPSVTINHFLDFQRTGPVSIPATLEGKTVTVIGMNAFNNCFGITGVTIPTGVTTVQGGAFSSCTSLSSVQLPAGLTNLGASSFSNCPKLKTIHLPGSLTTASEAFGFDSKLETVTFGAGATIIPAKVLYSCHAVRSVTIPSSVQRIGDSAFAYCRKLETVKLPAGLKEIGDESFTGCHLIDEVDIPTSVTSIGDWAFSSTFLREIRLPKKLVHLGAGAFASCPFLEEANLPSGIKEVPARLFLACYMLKKPVIPSGTTRVGQQAFAGCKFERVSFPASLRELGKGAFENCSNLRTAIFTGKAPAVEGRIFSRTASDFAIFLEDGAKGFTLPRWNGYPTSKPRPEIAISTLEGRYYLVGQDLGIGSKEKFPAGIVGRKDSYRTFVIHNAGTLPLTNLTATIKGGNSKDFIIQPLKKTSIAPGKSFTLKVRFAPTEIGKRRTQLRIGSSDANENPYTLDLSATGLKKS